MFLLSFILKVSCLGSKFYPKTVPLEKAYDALRYGWAQALASELDEGVPTGLDMTEGHSFYVQEIKSLGPTFKKISYFTNLI